MTAAVKPADCAWCYGPLSGHGEFIEHRRALHMEIGALEDAERTCKAANESQRKSIDALDAELADYKSSYDVVRKQRDDAQAENAALKAGRS